jgi:2'-5' RNA ligase
MKITNQPSSYLQTDQDLWDYLLVAHPDERVNEKIKEEKQFFYLNYGQKTTVQTKSHITIASFLAKERMEETLTRWIQNICNLHCGFEVTLNNFSGFPPHAVYLRVQDPKPFKKLTNALKILDNFIQTNDCPPLHPATKPHLTIAKGLPGDVYEKAIKEYAGRTFHDSFMVDKLVLLKRDAQYKCRLVNTFTLPPPLTLFE